MFGRRRLRSARAARPPARRWPRRARAALRRCADGAGAGGAPGALCVEDGAGGWPCGGGAMRLGARASLRASGAEVGQERPASRGGSGPAPCPPRVMRRANRQAPPRGRARHAAWTRRKGRSRARPTFAPRRRMRAGAATAFACRWAVRRGRNQGSGGRATGPDAEGGKGGLSGGKSVWTGRAVARPPDPAPAACNGSFSPPSVSASRGAAASGISTCRRPGGESAASRIPDMPCASSRSPSCAGEMSKAGRSGAGQCRASAQARVSRRSESSGRRPISSARGRNASGGTGPSSPGQRASASNPSRSPRRLARRRRNPRSTSRPMEKMPATNSPFTSASSSIPSWAGE